MNESGQEKRQLDINLLIKQYQKRLEAKENENIFLSVSLEQAETEIAELKNKLDSLEPKKSDK